MQSDQYSNLERLVRLESEGYATTPLHKNHIHFTHLSKRSLDLCVFAFSSQPIAHTKQDTNIINNFKKYEQTLTHHKIIVLMRKIDLINTS